MVIKRTCFEIPHEDSKNVIKIHSANTNLNDVMEAAGYTKLNALDIENCDEVFTKDTGIEHNRLFTKNGSIYTFLCWSTKTGMMDVPADYALIYKIGAIVYKYACPTCDRVGEFIVDTIKVFGGSPKDPLAINSSMRLFFHECGHSIKFKEVSFENFTCIGIRV